MHCFATGFTPFVVVFCELATFNGNVFLNTLDLFDVGRPMRQV